MAKAIGFGSELSVASTTGTLDIGQIRSISGPDSEYDDVDTTTLDSSTNFRTFIPGLADPGALTIELVADPTLASHSRLSTYFEAGSLKTYTVSHATSANTQSFSAYVKSIGQEIPLDDLVTRSVVFKVSGDPGWTS